MAIDLAQLVVSLEANSAKFQKDMERVEKRIDRFASRTSASLRNVRNAFIGLGIGAVLREVIKSADAIGDTARRVGLSARAYQELRFAAGQLDVEVGELDASLARFNKTLGDARRGSPEAAKAFKQLGLDPAQFKDTDTAFIAVTQRLGRVQDSFARASLQAQIFGKDAGPKLAAFLGASAAEVEKLRNEAHALGAVLSDEAIAKADETTKKFDALSKVLSVQLSEALVNLTPLLTGTASILATVARWMGEAFRDAQGLADELSRLAAFGPGGMGPSRLGDRFDPAKTNEEHQRKVEALRETYAELGRAIARVGEAGGSTAQTRIAILEKRRSEIKAEMDALTGTPRALVGPTTAAVASSTIKILTEAQLKAIEDHEKLLAKTREEVMLLNDAEGEAAKMRALVNELYAKGKIPQDAYLAFLEEASNELDDLNLKGAEAEDKLSAFADQAARNMQTFTASMVDAALAGEDLGDAVTAALRRIAAELITLTILRGVSGAASSSDSAFLQMLGTAVGAAIGGREHGGPVSGGAPYVVGEAGPELFVPRSSGMVVPSGGMMGGVTITQNIDARGADPTSTANMIRALQASNQKLKAEMYDEIRRGTAPI